MSKIGYGPDNIGKETKVSFTHYLAYDLLKDCNGSLEPNSIIVCSPLQIPDNEYVDRGSYAMIATDAHGYGVRLTYSIVPGNGLVVNSYMHVAHGDLNYTQDTLSLEIDRDSIMPNEYEELHVAKTNIIDNDTLMVALSNDKVDYWNEGSTSSGWLRPRTRIGVITGNLDKASDIAYGVVRGDSLTIHANNGVMSVETSNLDYVDDFTNTSGIVRFNPDIVDDYDWRTVEASNGVLRVLTYNLDRATAEQVGVVKPDMVTTYTELNGDISVRTAGLEKATDTSYGIVKPDNFTVKIAKAKSGETEYDVPGVLSVDARNLSGASNDEYGVVKLDSYSLSVNAGGFTQVNRFHEIVAILDRYMADYDYIISRLIDHENRISALENAAAAEFIYSFTNYGKRTTTLSEPYWDEETNQVISETEQKTAVFSINTNCPFNVSFEFEDNTNVTPQITLQTVRLGNGEAVEASALQNYIFSSTNMNESTLSFTFNCRNYTSSTDESFTMTTVIVKVSSINKSSIYKIGSHIFKRWNMQKYKKPVRPYNNLRFVTSSEETHEQYGPYLQYYTDGSLQHATGSFVTAPVTEDTTDLTASMHGAAIAQQAVYDDGDYTPNNANLVSYLVSYSPEYGSYAFISAHQLARTSYSFKFSTLIVDKKTTTTSTKAFDEDGIEFDVFDAGDQKPKPIRSLDGGITWEIVEYDPVSGEWVPAPSDESADITAISPTVTTTTEYSVSYMSSPLSASSSSHTYGMNIQLEQFTRSRLINGLNDEGWQQLGVDSGDTIGDEPSDPSKGGRAASSSDNGATAVANPNLFSYNISTLASNTGMYNILTISSIYPLTTVDRMATVTITAANQAKNSVPDTSGKISAISGMFTDSLKFSLIEDVIADHPKVSISIQCNDDSDNPLEVTVTRSSDSILESGAATWGCSIEYTFLKYSGNSATNGETMTTGTAVDNTKGHGTRAEGTNNGDDPLEVAHINLSIDGIPAAAYEYTWTIDGKNEADLRRFLSNSVYEYYKCNSPYNDVYTIAIYTGSPEYEKGFKLSGIYDGDNAVLVGGANVSGLPRVYGTWPIHLNTIPQDTTFSFGNAEIRSISMVPWGDNRMEIQFTIRPGSTTRLSCATISPVGTPNVVLYNGNTPINWNTYYTRCWIDNAEWTAQGCVVRMFLDQGGAESPTNLFNADIMANSSYMVSANSPLLPSTTSSTQTQGAVIVAFAMTTGSATGPDGHSAQQNSALGQQHPLITSITGMKFYFMLTASGGGKTCNVNFAPTLGALSPKVSINAQFNTGASKNLQISNALYNPAAGGLTQQEQNTMAQEQSAGTSVGDLANTLADVQAQLENLQNMVNNNI